MSKIKKRFKKKEQVTAYEIEYEKWDQVVISAQLLIASVVCLVEIVNNILLYVTRSQGYGPDTIVQKLIRYLLITSATNFTFVILSKIVATKSKKQGKRRFWLLLFTTLICSNVAFSHYQFATTFGIFVVPLIVSILYEDWELSKFTFHICLVGQAVAVIARAIDAEYNKDIAPEAAIGFSLTIATFFFAKMIYATLRNRREAVKEAIIKAEKASANAEKMAFSFKMLETLAGTIDAKDKYTNGHSMRVAIYSTILAEKLGWEAERIEKLRYEALLHDIGKIGVPDSILNKPSRLSDAEFGLIKSHTVIGSDILKNMIAVPNASEVAKHHHERYDGKGYPSSLQGTEIPVNARVVCIADSFDAMNSDRIYRKALPREVIREELVKGRGTQFDPEMLDAFLELFDARKLETASDVLYVTALDKNQQQVMEDIERVISRMTSLDQFGNNDFDKFYKYMRNIGIRYNRSVEVLSVDLDCIGDLSADRLEEAVTALSIAIKKNIRAVDVYYKYSATRHMIILLDAGVENLDVVKQRILFDYNATDISVDYGLRFSLNESIAAPNQEKTG